MKSNLSQLLLYDYFLQQNTTIKKEATSNIGPKDIDANNELEKTIERLRGEFLIKERFKADCNSDIRKRRTRNRYLKTLNKSKVNTYKDYTMDFNGDIIPLDEFPIEDCKDYNNVDPKIKVLVDSVYKTSANYNYLSRNIKDSTNDNCKVVNNNNEFNMIIQNPLFKAIRNKNTLCKTFLNIVPNYGVTFQVDETIKKGPNFDDDPNLMGKTMNKFYKEKNSIKKTFRKTITVKEEELSKSIERNDLNNSKKLSKLTNILIDNDEFSSTYNRKCKSTKANYKLNIGTIPIPILYEKQQMNQTRIKLPRIIIEKQKLEKDLKFIEGNINAKFRATINRNIWKSHSCERNSKQKRNLYTTQSRYKMPPPPLGKIFGHGLFNTNT